MKHLVRELQEDELKDLARLSVSAFSVKGSLEDAENDYLGLLRMLHTNASEVHIHGAYHEEKLVGGLRMTDYRMNVRNNFIDIGGAAGVATDMLYKKEKVAKDMIEHFIRYYREKGAVMTVLYPFRADFYRKMGFGLGTEIKEYRIMPSEFPFDDNSTRLEYMDANQRDSINACYERFASRRNGMTMKTGADYFWLFYEGSNRIVAYKEGEEVKGYLSFSFQKEGMNTNNMLIEEFVYENDKALLSLCTFLHKQSDQIDRVIIKSQDENLHYIFGNPSNGSYIMMHDSSESCIGEVAVGMMYRVINTKRIFELLEDAYFGMEQLKLKLSVKDNLIEENNCDLILHFSDGMVKVLDEGDYEVEVCISIDNFSSILMGAVSVSRLYSLGLVEIDKREYVDKISRIFALEIKPMCISTF